MSYENLPPVEEPVERPPRLRQSLLAKFEQCPRSAYLSLRHNGGATSHDLMRGTAIHRIIEQATKEIVGLGETQIPGDLMKRIVAEVIEDPALVLTAAEADRVRVQAWHWAEATVLDPSEVVAIEQRFTLDVGGWTVSGKVDLALMRDERGVGPVCELDDYKSTFAYPEQDDYATRRRDGSLAWVEFQGVVYALLFAFGIPDGGYEPIGERVNLFRVAQVLPAYLYEGPGGLVLGRRSATITRDELTDHRDFLEALVSKVGASFESGKWQAVPGSHCSRCPCRPECPIPAALRDLHGSIDTVEDCAEAAVRHKFLKDQAGGLWRELRATLTHLGGPLRFGRDLELTFEPETRTTTDWEGLERGIEDAVEYGRPFDLSKYRKESQSSRLKQRKRADAS